MIDTLLGAALGLLSPRWGGQLVDKIKSKPVLRRSGFRNVSNDKENLGLRVEGGPLR